MKDGELMGFDNQLFARILKEIRESKMTREDFAEALKMEERSIARIEDGSRLTTIPNLIEICNILKISPNDIFNDYIKVQETQVTSTDFQELLHLLYNMNTTEISLILDIVKSIKKNKT